MSFVEGRWENTPLWTIATADETNLERNQCPRKADWSWLFRDYREGGKPEGV